MALDATGALAYKGRSVSLAMPLLMYMASQFFFFFTMTEPENRKLQAVTKSYLLIFFFLADIFGEFENMLLSDKRLC
jgi:hypothetical protein